jgi:enoyl-CoA hydratase/carnithine racemase
MQLETMYSTADDRVATVVLNRPDVLNCANEQWTCDFNTLVDELANNKDLRVVIVRGAGRAFCTGIDLTALSQGEIGMTFFRDWETALRKLEMLDPVVIAAIHSHVSVAVSKLPSPVTCVSRAMMPGSGSLQ